MCGDQPEADAVRNAAGFRMPRDHVLRPVLRNGRFFKTVIVVAFLCGCSTPKVEFMNLECRRIERDGQLEAIAFKSTLNLDSLHDRQLVYQVGLVDCNNQPIKSRDGQFQNTYGNVAVGKTLMGWSDLSIPRDISVVIPAKQLEVRHEHVPVWAEFGIYYPDKTCLARELARLPLRVDDEILGPVQRSFVAKSSPDEPVEEAESEAEQEEPEVEESADSSRQERRFAKREAGNEPSSPRPEPDRRDDDRSVGLGQAEATVKKPFAPVAGAYKVKKGDTLRSIAQTFYGDARFWRLIHEANPGMPVWLRPGDVIQIPPKNQRTSKATKLPVRGPSTRRDRQDFKADEGKSGSKTGAVASATDTKSPGASDRSRRDSKRWSEPSEPPRKSQPRPKAVVQATKPDDRTAQSEPARRQNKIPVDKPSSMSSNRGSPKALPASFLARIEEQEKRAAVNSGNLEEQFRLRVMYVIAGRDHKALAPFDGVESTAEETLLARLRSMIASRSGHQGEDPHDLYKMQLDSIEDLRQILRATPVLGVGRVVFCNEIEGFGQYEPIDPVEFSAGQKSTTLIYIEVDSFVSEKTSDGRHKTLLSVITRVKDKSGAVIRRNRFDGIEDLAHQQRRDFFLSIRAFEIPKGMASGEYRLEIEVKDLLGGGTGQNVARFSIVP